MNFFCQIKPPMNSPGFIFKKQNKKQCSTLSEIVDLQKFDKVLVDFFYSVNLTAALINFLYLVTYTRVNY